MSKLRFVLIMLVIIAICVLMGGRFLVIDNPEHSDVILVLAGDTQIRPQHGVDLLGQSYARNLILDVPAEEKVFQWRTTELAQRWISGSPLGREMSVCSIHGLSTKEESHEAGKCIAGFKAHNVLIVTSDFHSRRALSIFSHELPELRFTVASAYNRTEFGSAWWQHREWAKTAFYEWIRLLWWEAIDRWR